ncbi:hypothetical protein FY557_08175 [Chryseobacterium sp. SN22]|uniref:transglycosylase domain-containing protein n=1 Tax=Chryseobacterium sp. SN22 TaxID=2606431 RepID=UPI0011EDD16D|nr:transglycosylase domain-containing protein [Chryseobacterium sp. SN22]KAA0128547.1 hypothetical protein FY557_08175 [Chryseobacterium sp. SN22]
MIKYIRWVFTLLFAIFVLFVLYLEFGGKYILNTFDKRSITYEIKSNRKLPENFILFYNTIYPNSLSSNSWNYRLSSLLKSGSSGKDCPCSQTAYRLFPVLEIHNKKGIDEFLTARYIERHFSQKECLAFNFSHFDFLKNGKGIFTVSKSLFQKELKDLKPLEMAEIVALYENPVRYNRFRNPEKAQKRAEHFYTLYLNNFKTKN